MEINSPLGRIRSKTAAQPKTLSVSDESGKQFVSRSTNFNSEIDFDNLPEHMKGKIEDLPELNEVPDLVQSDQGSYLNSKPSPNPFATKSTLPEGAVEISPEQFNKFQREKEKILEDQNKIDPKAKEALNALLGFGISEKKVPLNFKGKKYIIYLSNLTDDEEKEITKARANMETLSLQDQDNGRLKAVDLIYQIRKQTVHLALKKIEFVDLSGPNVFSINEVLSFFQFDSVDQLLHTWGSEVINLLYAAYADSVKEITTYLSSSELSDNLKK